MKRYEEDYEEADEIEEEPFSPFNELCRFADEYHLSVELDKPFPEMNQMYLRVKDKDGQDIEKILLEDIIELNSKSANTLNRLTKVATKWQD